MDVLENMNLSELLVKGVEVETPVTGGPEDKEEIESIEVPPAPEPEDVPATPPKKKEEVVEKKEIKPVVEEEEEEAVEEPEEIETTPAVEEPEEVDAVKELADEFGVDAEGLDESYDGFKKLVTKATAKLHDDFVQQHEDLPELMQYLSQGGTVKQYVADIRENVTLSNWTNVEFDKDDVNQQKDIMRALIKRQGLLESEEIDAEIADLVASDRIGVRSERALSVLKKAEKLDIDTQMKAKAEATKQQEEDAKVFWKEVETTVDNGDLGSIMIPAKDKKQFFEYIAKPVEGGQTQSTLDSAKLTTKQRIALQYWMFKQGDFSQLIATKARSLNAKKYAKGSSNPAARLKSKMPSKTQNAAASTVLENVDMNKAFFENQ